MKERKSLFKKLVSLCFICVRKHDKSDTETYENEEKVINEIIDEL
jgi:hypothetical protein